MHEFKDWKEFINRVLIDSGKFKNPKTAFKGDTEIETFKSTTQNSLTEIEVGYIKDNLLIYLQIVNPQIPGHNKFIEGEYFDDNSFDLESKQTKVGLDFNELNTNGILDVLKRGLFGTETQFILNGKILKSIVDTDDHPAYISQYDFTGRSFVKKLLAKRIEKMNGIEKREIQLNQIFSGI